MLGQSREPSPGKPAMNNAITIASHATHPLTSLVVILAVSSGCIREHENKAKLNVGVTQTDDPLAKSAAYRDTIGSLTYYEGMGPMRVRGYGMVVGLGKNGSSDCPRPIYDRLVQNLYKHHRFSSSVVGEKNITPEQLIADPDTAVVLVQGEIPPAAVEGTRFDVVVMALPGTQTKSLRGGRLFTADLEIFRELSSSVSISGQILAVAAGPVFLNPFAEGDAATKSNPLEGIVVGGGMAVKDRRVRLDEGVQETCDSATRLCSTLPEPPRQPNSARCAIWQHLWGRRLCDSRRDFDRR